jgi:hypothetical protein
MSDRQKRAINIKILASSYTKHKYSPYRAVNTLRLSYTNQSVNVVQ